MLLVIDCKVIGKLFGFSIFPNATLTLLVAIDSTMRRVAFMLVVVFCALRLLKASIMPNDTEANICFDIFVLILLSWLVF